MKLWKKDVDLWIDKPEQRPHVFLQLPKAQFLSAHSCVDGNCEQIGSTSKQLSVISIARISICNFLDIESFKNSIVVNPRPGCLAYANWPPANSLNFSRSYEYLLFLIQQWEVENFSFWKNKNAVVYRCIRNLK